MGRASLSKRVAQIAIRRNEIVEETSPSVLTPGYGGLAAARWKIGGVKDSGIGVVFVEVHAVPIASSVVLVVRGFSSTSIFAKKQKKSLFDDIGAMFLDYLHVMEKKPRYASELALGPPRVSPEPLCPCSSQLDRRQDEPSEPIPSSRDG
jgi:hypothetical protein